ncbi:MAG: hypothetical protein HOD92_08590 [Deltaproteobacteria bacterium]|jgi:hypothetical protein|nr:hypothetical protein [Deltaproteobacteria bacterium]
MDDQMNEVVLTIKCNDMADPKIQRSKFDQTLDENGWFLLKQEEVKRQGNLISTTTIWTQSFILEKPPARIEKQIRNLLKRAAEYAEIEFYSADYIFRGNRHSI